MSATTNKNEAEGWNRLWNIGQTVRVVRDVDLSPHTVIEVGETGTIVRPLENSPLDGYMIQWHTPHKGLKAWDNCFSLVGEELAALKRAWVPRLSQCIIAALIGAVAGVVIFEFFEGVAQAAAGFCFLDALHSIF